MTDTSFNRPVQLPTREAPRGAGGEPSGISARAAWVFTTETWLLLALAGVTFVAHMLVSGNYGYFRDELYYLADGRHLQAGYVDQPALLGWLAALLRVTVGNGLAAIHVIPALAGAAIVVVAGLMARELGGGRVAQLVAGAAALFSLDLRGAASIFSMDVLDQLWWALASLVLARMLRLEAPLGPNAAADLPGCRTRRLWLALGLVAAMGFLTKLTMLFFCLAVVLALLATPVRRHLRTPWPWLAAAIAAAGLLPYLVWNAVNGWPTLDFYRQYRYLTTGPLEFLINQLILMNPMAIPLAVAGLVFYFSKTGRRYRVLGWIFVLVYVILTGLRGKPYFLGPAYPILFAAGAVAFERFRPRRWLAWIRPSYVVLLALVGAMFAPLAMPILPPAAFQRIYGSLGGASNAAIASGSGIMPQNLADRFGWDSLTQTVQRVYAALPPEERAQACVLTGNYGEASALSLLAAPGSLPPIISAHNNYYLWGPGACSGRVIILVGYSESFAQNDASASYTNVALAATVDCPYCASYERNLRIYVLSGVKDPSFDLRNSWPSLKHFD
jgi:4-amino-4-deoxy-L-arabinose transferase-like glycosyltransferase